MVKMYCITFCVEALRLVIVYSLLIGLNVHSQGACSQGGVFESRTPESVVFKMPVTSHVSTGHF